MVISDDGILVVEKHYYKKRDQNEISKSLTSKKKGKIILKKNKQSKITKKEKQTKKQTNKNKNKKKETKKERKENICFFLNIVFGQYTLRDTKKHFHKHFKFHTNSIYFRNIWC
jgi:septum formation inhibitor MinC